VQEVNPDQPFPISLSSCNDELQEDSQHQQDSDLILPFLVVVVVGFEERIHLKLDRKEIVEEEEEDRLVVDELELELEPEPEPALVPELVLVLERKLELEHRLRKDS